MKLIKSVKIGIVSLFVFGAVMLGCEEEIIKADGNRDIDTCYFPLEIGNYIIYKLDSIKYDDFNMTDTTISLWVRELVESSFFDNSENEIFRIERSYKRDEAAEWGSAGFDIWSAHINDNNAEKVEENQRYVKLGFPLFEGKEWSGNQYINTDPIDDGSIDSMIESPLVYLEGWQYKVVSLHNSYALNGLNFDSTVTVLQHQFGIQTDTVGAFEIYAKNIGLIEKEVWVLSTQCSICDPNDTVCKIECFNSNWEDKAEAGFIFKMKILEYGKL